MVRNIHHVGIVVRSLEEALRFYRDGLGLPVIKRAVLKDQGVHALLLGIGASAIELLEPIDQATGIAKFLDRRGEGLHHLCFETQDVAKELAELRAKGVTLIDETPREGLAGRIAFLHPKSTGGVLVELVSPSDLNLTGREAVRMKRVVITSHNVGGSCDLFRSLFAITGKSVNGSARALLDVGQSALLIVPAEEAGGVEGMLALSLVADDLSGILTHLKNRGVSLRSGAGEITIEPVSSHGVHLHISRYP